MPDIELICLAYFVNSSLLFLRISEHTQDFESDNGSVYESALPYVGKPSAKNRVRREAAYATNDKTPRKLTSVQNDFLHYGRYKTPIARVMILVNHNLRMMIKGGP